MADTNLELNGRQRERLCAALISAFPTRGEIARLVDFELDVDLEVVAGGETYGDVIFNLVKWTVAQGKVAALVAGSRKQNPGNSLLRAFDEQILHPPPGKDSDSQVDLVSMTLRPGEVAGPIVPLPGSLNDIDRFRPEYIQNVVDWCAGLQEAAAAVCRLESHDVMATAFLIGSDLAITLYSVLEPLLDAGYYENPVTGIRTTLAPEGVVLRFGYTTLASGQVRPSYPYHLAADWLIDSSPIDDLDYVLLRVDGTPGMDLVEDSGGKGTRNWLRPADAYELQSEEPLYVLHHSNGRPLQVSYATGAQLDHQRTRFDYQTLTAGGAAGAPCFSAKWELVGMHEANRSRITGKPTQRQGIPMAAIVAQPKVRAALVPSADT